MSLCKCNTKSFKGKDGRSAYEVWIDAGNVGTEAQFLTSLQGTPGQNGIYLLNPDTGVASATTVTGSDENLKTFVLPIASLPTNGSQLIIETRFVCTPNNLFKLAKLWLDAATYMVVNMNTSVKVILVTQNIITRLTSTTVTNEKRSWIYDMNFVMLTNPQNEYTVGLTVANLNTTTITIKTTGFSSVTAGNVSNQYLIVKKIIF